MKALEKMMANLGEAFGTVERAKKLYDQETDALVEQIRALESERDRVFRAARPLEGLLPLVDQVVDQSRKEYLQDLGEQLQRWGDPKRAGLAVLPQDVPNLDILATTSLAAFQNKYGEKMAAYHLARILFALLGDQIKAAVRAAPYFQETGLPEGARREKLAQLDGRISALKSRLGKLEQDALRAGLDV